MQSAQSSGLDVSLSLWTGATMLLDAINDPSSLVDVAMDPKEIYLGIIMSVMETAGTIELVNPLFQESADNCSTFVSTVYSVLKELYQINDANKKSFDALSKAEKARVLKEAGERFDTKVQPDLGDLGETLSTLTDLLDLVSSIEDYYNLCTGYLLTRYMCDSSKTVLRQAYAESCKGSNTAMQSAFQECIKALNSSEEEFIAMFRSGAISTLGVDTAKFLFKELVWQKVKTMMGPNVAILMAIYSVEKMGVNLLMKPDAMQDSYHALLAVREVEDVFKASKTALEQKYLSNRSVETAGAYLDALQLAYQAIDVDCNQAYQFVDTADNAGWRWVKRAFGSDDSFQSEKDGIRKTQEYFRTAYTDGTNAWKNALATGFNPFTGECDYRYTPASDTASPILGKQLTIACPVNVYVYSPDGQLAASVEDGKIMCADNLVMIARIGDQKYVRIYSDADYRVECMGTDTGTMDLTLTEYGDGGEETRAAEFYSVPLTAGRRYVLNDPAESEAYALQDAAAGKPVQPDYDTAKAGVFTASMKDGMVTFREQTAVQCEIPAGATAGVATFVPEGYTFAGWKAVGGTVAFEDSHALTTTFTMPAEDVTIQAVFQAETQEPPHSENPFTDIREGDYYYDAVLWAVNHRPQITNGTSETLFSPNAACTRGQMVTFLWRAAGCPQPKSSKIPFKDVSASAYYYQPVLWAVEQGITNGTSDTTFSPDQTVDRAQTVTFLWRMHNTPETKAQNPFTDVKSGTYYYHAVLWAVENQVTNGTSATTFSPSNPCTRAQIVTFIYRDMG